jgi:D-sedoheptulose 7-phosphate isomerase
MDTVLKNIWHTRISTHLADSAALKARIDAECGDAILIAGRAIARSLAAGGKLMLCGNGGSAADAQHLAGEFVNILAKQFPRPPMAALALTTDTSCLTAVGNDLGFEHVFERQVLALGRPGDTLLAISTSGQSENVIRAVRSAAELRIGTIGLLGASGGRLASLVDVAILVPSEDVQHVQEAHLTIEHILCDLVERMIHSEEDRMEM